MLTTLSSVKARLSLPPADTTYDALLTSAINAVSARFDRETNRTLARTVGATHEFDPLDTELLVPCYPIESVQKFELKQTEPEGWLEQPDIPFLIRSGCIITLHAPSPVLLIQEGMSCPAPRSLLPPPRYLRTWKTPPLSKSPTGSKPAIISA